MGDNVKTAHIANLNGLLADAFALYIKTKNFHWHVRGPQFRDLHLLFDEQAAEIFALTDLIAERVRKNGATTHTSLGSLNADTRIKPQDRADLAPEAMIGELVADNRTFLAQLRATKDSAGEAGDNATDGIIDDWTDQCEQRIWFLSQTIA
ncbi:Dps family protein [Novosphingobium piscinae]|uniref:DNA starvation/stationary phase protection protein n=1 Tax=Novosphingobium piscinae TaxID=1507448 RepID=A0A7X1G103_9SPHN|nr:DNA starvation/stationary phase protection protein [Novosphingobium piscinae]MBC2670670.1 DNA starvation/stationary phase protection protein [Novosphingobium piscinae]